ncbi:recombinase family protein [Subtercola boreus]|uniref:recombinase family protein n=1 Tax=Subtercola boreus TaxID=120213 RepID=UPI003F5A8656
MTHRSWVAEEGPPDNVGVTSGEKVAASRPAMMRLLEHVVDGDTVVVWRIDRLGRSSTGMTQRVSACDLGLAVFSGRRRSGW